MAISLKEKEKRQKFQFVLALGRHIKATRLRKGISGAELARLLYMERSNISRLENGKVNPSIYLLKQICIVLEISLFDFWKGFEE